MPIRTKEEKIVLITYLNEMIEAAVNYGGDRGGAYFTKEYRNEILDKMSQFKVEFLGDEFEIVFDRDMPRFSEKESTT